MRRIVTSITAAALLVFACGSALAAEQPPAKLSAVAPAAARLDINKATVEELVGVPGIGPRMAVAIVEFRTAQGPLRSLQDLLQVRGIKEKKLLAISPYLVVNAAPPATAAPATR